MLKNKILMKLDKNTVIIFATYTLADPTTRNTIESVSKFYDRVVVVDHNPGTAYRPLNAKGLIIESISDLKSLPRLGGLKNLFKWWVYSSSCRRILNKYRPGLVITFMLRPLAAIKPAKGQTMISCIYDIPDPETAGKIDRGINKAGFRNLSAAALVWASDSYKAALAKDFGKLDKMPLVCHNSPARDGGNLYKAADRLWLREKLMLAGAPVSESKGIIMVRAGAIGPYGGIEETLEAMKQLPDDYIFLMMGRPGEDYKAQLNRLISDEGLEQRAIFWDRPTDDEWQKAINGADIGHLLHLAPPAGTIAAGLYRYNSSLSNYRLFTYMAAGLPIFSYNDPRLDALHKEVNCFCVLDVTRLRDEIIHAWQRISNDSVLRTRMAQAARDAYEHTYNWEVQFREVRKYIEKLQ